MKTASDASPLVSVIVPAFNAAATLRDTLAAIAAQRYAPFEIIIVDDGSTDDTAAIARDFCSTNPRARLIRQGNGGVAAARNAAISVAAGNYLAPVDADDLWHPDYLRMMVEKARATEPPPGFVFAWHRRIDAAGDILSSVANVDIAGRALHRLAYRNLVGNGSGILIDRAALDEAGGYEPGLRKIGLEGTEDFLLQLSVAARRPVATVPAYLVGYRIAPGSMSSDGERMFASRRHALRLYAARFPNAPLPPRTWRWVRAKRALLLAHRGLSNRRLVASVRHMAQAAFLDPLATIAMIRDYLTRPARNAPAARTPFHAADPATMLPYESAALTHSASLALERKRLRSLAATEAVDSSGTGCRPDAPGGQS